MRTHHPMPAALEDGLGYTFKDRSLLNMALRPPSAGLPGDNQRLEFLGDSVLHLCVSLLLCREHPDWSEGALSKIRGMLVCTDALHRWASDLGVTLERGPRSPRQDGVADLRNALADAMEALLAAVYLDAQAAGGDPLAQVLAIVQGRFLEEVRSAYVGIWEKSDSKTTLQERGAALGLPPPVYELVERSGPDHAPVFTVRAVLGPHGAVASAGSLKRAQAEAARALLEMLPDPSRDGGLGLPSQGTAAPRRKRKHP